MVKWNALAIARYTNNDKVASLAGTGYQRGFNYQLEHLFGVLLL